MAKELNKKKLKYNFPNFNPNSLDPQNIDKLAVEEVPVNSTVLDIGCATGFMGEYLIKEKGCKVIGIDVSREELKFAKKRLTRVVLADIEDEENIKKIIIINKNKKFACILATSIIEHLKNPAKFLQICKKLLTSDGKIIVSTPNIAHWSMRMSLLKGRFDYTEYGILDNTHLHFFTLHSFQKIFKDNGYQIKKLRIDPVGGGYPRISKILAIFFPNIFAYQILIVAQKKNT